MIQITDELIDYLADLSKLKIEANEKASYKNDLQQIITFMDKLEEINTDGVTPLIHMSPRVNVLRDDEVKGSISRLDAMKNAPANDGTFFKVPKVIDK